MLITDDMNKKPWKYATHCLCADKYGTIFIAKENEQQQIYVDGTWQPSDVYSEILEEIETEFHPAVDDEYNLISRSLINHYQEILDSKGLNGLWDVDTDLCNSNSMGAVSHIIAIRVVLFNNDLSFKDYKG